MRVAWKLLVIVGILLPVAAFAGPPLPVAVPTLGEVGLVALGIGLIGGGAAALRRRNR